MSNIESIYIIVVTLITILTLLILGVISSYNLVFDKNQKLRFIHVFGLICLCALIDAIMGFMEASGNPNYVGIDSFLNFVNFALPPLIPLLIARCLFNGERNKWPYSIYLVYLIVLSFLSAFNQIYTVSPDCEYQRQLGFYYFYLPMYALSFIYLFIETIRLIVKLAKDPPMMLVLIFISILTSTIMQVFFQDIVLHWLASGINAIIYYTYIVTIWNQMDGLTGLYNQESFLLHLEKLKDGEALFVFDADNFKMVNDEYGHLIGDKVLISMAKIIRNTFNRKCRCYRLGGDEFAVIAKKGCDFDLLQSQFNSQINKAQSSIYTTISVGYRVFKKGDDLNEFATAADKSMYLNKLRMKSK